MICFLAATLLLFLFQKELDAFQTGAGGCDGDMAAVGGKHLDTTGGRPVVQYSALFLTGVEVKIGSTVLDGSGVNDFPIGQDLQISVIATTNDQYKGVLVRLEAPAGVNTAAALLPGTNTAIATQCVSPIIGITHTNSNFKAISTGIIRFDEEVLNVELDITVVISNEDDFSIFAYNKFLVNFRGAPIPPPTPPAPAPSAPGSGMGGGMGVGGMVVGMGGGGMGGGMGTGW